MNKSSYIGSVIQYIEQSLTDDIDPESVARRNFISLSQLYRDFYSRTGHSVKEYIRRRRISNACEKIKCSDMPLSVIAGESGCRTQQAFNKQFKSIVGMTPLEYRQGDTYYYFYPFSAEKTSISVRVGNEEIPGCAVTRFYDPCLAGIEDKAVAALGQINGRVFGRNGKQIGSRFCYEIMTESGGPGKTDTYATCVVAYNERDISGGWNYLYNVWLSASMFEQSEDGYFEEYLFKDGRPNRLKLYLPVRKRRTAQHISISHIPDMSFIAAREKGSGAERRASRRVMDFLQERYPLLIRSARRYYVCALGDAYECGVECGSDFKLPCGSGLEILHIPSGQYAVLPDSCLGDVRVGMARMELWLSNNSVSHDTSPVFAVYETADGRYDADNIRMCLYKKLSEH